ncbi:hypothetical protein [Streptomyces sp. N35]|uniref:hypothetical protein n=1 Tax=Streptomyces sp. N35 TaxID=2795730 RepID=UPI001F292DA6|nr:hypothetical protein [Streptomyces sp. N35]
MKRTHGAVAALIGIIALTACSADARDRDPDTLPDISKVSLAAPSTAQLLAEQYRKNGGIPYVSGIEQMGSGRKGVPLVAIWTDAPKDKQVPFDDLKVSILDFLVAEDQISQPHGYMMTVVGPDGTFLHRFDASF